jgi:hypothetical protein
MFIAILLCQFPCAEIEENENKKMKDNELIKFCYELTCILLSQFPCIFPYELTCILLCHEVTCIKILVVCLVGVVSWFAARYK